VQGTNVVASMVVFEDGLPRKSEYRRFGMRSGTGDVDWIAEVIRRRFARYLDAQVEQGAAAEDTIDPEQVQPGIDPTTGRPKKFAYAPNLVVVDGGAPQVAAAQTVLDELGIEDVALVGLAKRLEEVWLPGEAYPMILPRASEALYLLQRVRDEAHRFAITFHRERRSKSMTVSALDGIAGLGETRRKALMARFGSLKRLRAASAEQIAEVPGIGPRTAAAIVSALHRDDAPAQPAINMTTGEVLEDSADDSPEHPDGGEGRHLDDRTDAPTYQPTDDSTNRHADGPADAKDLHELSADPG
jgi:excinuclease ABC subunit C